MAQVSNDAPSAAPPSAAPAVRVVYPDGGSTKSTGKATDIAETTPPAQVEPLPTRSVTLTPTPVVLRTPDTTDNSSALKPADQASAGSQPDPALDQPADQGSSAAPAKMADLSPTAASPTSSATDTKAAPKLSININNASIEALNHLPGAGRIGQAIASHRPYHSVEDLLKKRVVRRNVYDQIKGQLAAQ